MLSVIRFETGVRTPANGYFSRQPTLPQTGTRLWRLARHGTRVLKSSRQYFDPRIEIHGFQL